MAPDLIDIIGNTGLPINSYCRSPDCAAFCPTLVASGMLPSSPHGRPRAWGCRQLSRSQVRKDQIDSYLVPSRPSWIFRNEAMLTVSIMKTLDENAIGDQ